MAWAIPASTARSPGYGAYISGASLRRRHLRLPSSTCDADMLRCVPQSHRIWWIHDSEHLSRHLPACRQVMGTRIRELYASQGAPESLRPKIIQNKPSIVSAAARPTLMGTRSVLKAKESVTGRPLKHPLPINIKGPSSYTWSVY